MIELFYIDGYIQGNTFIVERLGGHIAKGVYKADSLRSLARVVGNEAFTYRLDNDESLFIPEEQATIMTIELNKIAAYLEDNEDINNNRFVLHSEDIHIYNKKGSEIKPKKD